MLPKQILEFQGFKFNYKDYDSDFGMDWSSDDSDDSDKSDSDDKLDLDKLDSNKLVLDKLNLDKILFKVVKYF